MHDHVCAAISTVCSGYVWICKDVRDCEGILSSLFYALSQTCSSLMLLPRRRLFYHVLSLGWDGVGVGERRASYGMLWQGSSQTPEHLKGYKYKSTKQSEALTFAWERIEG